MARSSKFDWKEVTDLAGRPLKKELNPFGVHPLNDCWDAVAESVITILNHKDVQWTSIDAVRIGYQNGQAFPILWIAVRPKSLSGEDGLQIARKCKGVLEVNSILDVQCEIREAERLSTTRPVLLKSDQPRCPTADLQVSLTTSLGTSISPVNYPYVEGTFGFYISSNNRLFGVTARHVVLPCNEVCNDEYRVDSASQAVQPLMLPGDAALGRMKCVAERERGNYTESMELLEKRGRSARQTGNIKGTLENFRKEIIKLDKLIKDLDEWEPRGSREVGHAVFSPPISADEDTSYTIDWCVSEISSSKIDPTNFVGNVIDLGSKVDGKKLQSMLNAHPESRPRFSYPTNGQLSVRGIIPIDEMKHPQMLDVNGKRCLLVLKRGSATGLKLGRANQIIPITRDYVKDGTMVTANEWAIFGYNEKMGPFSAPGDSSALIVDAIGRMGGLLNAGSGLTVTTDLTYATPMEFLLPHMEKTWKEKFDINPGPLEGRK